MNGRWKIISGSVLTIFALLTAGWGLDKHFVPREVHQLQIAEVSNQILQMQKNNQIQYWLYERNRWQGWVDRLQWECNQHPQDQRLQMQLQQAIRKRDEADREIQRLQTQ